MFGLGIPSGAGPFGEGQESGCQFQSKIAHFGGVNRAAVPSTEDVQGMGVRA